MAFTGTPVVKKVTETCFRITGLSLAAAASGTIGFSDKTVAAEVELEAPNWEPTSVPGAQGGDVSLQDAVKVSYVGVTDVGDAAPPISVVKSGDTHLDFVITFHNDIAASTATQVLEIYVELAGH